MHDNWLYSRMHQQELLRKAERGRLARAAFGPRKGIFNRLLARVGGLMVAAGQALHRRYAPARPPVTAFSIQPAPQPVANQHMVSWDTGDSSCEREPSETPRHASGFFGSAQSRRHRSSRKKSNG